MVQATMAASTGHVDTCIMARMLSASTHGELAMCLQVRCTASINFGSSSINSASVTTASGGQAVVVFPPGGVASGSPGRVTVFCTAHPAQLVCVLATTDTSHWLFPGVQYCYCGVSVACAIT
jgi:hypothetical protein